MAGRGRIAIKENGIYKHIQVYYNSYIDSVGIMLSKYYKDVDKIKALINLGDILYLGTTVENNANSYEEHVKFEKEGKQGTITFIKEGRNWKDFEDYDPYVQWINCCPREDSNIYNVCGGLFTYIFDVEENKWYMAYCGEEFELKDLDVVLNSGDDIKKYEELQFVK